MNPGKRISTTVQVLHEDNHCLAIFKPAGLLAAGDRSGDTTALELARNYLREKYRKPGNVFIGLVHRLDRPASGVLLLAKTSKAAARLSDQFRSGAVRKKYLALVQGGHPAPPGEFTHWLVKDAQANKVHVVPPESSGAKRSVLVIEDAIPVEAHNLLRLCPLTGRPHQIRCQLSHLGVPIVGDIKYGAPGGASGKIALHAYSIQFRHPTRGEQIEITCPLPADWASYVTLRQPKLKQFTEPRSARITPAP